MEKDDIITKIAAFNFNKPVEVTVSFEDSDDEEITPVNKNRQEPEQESIDNNHIESHTIDQTKKYLKESNAGLPAEKAINSVGSENDNINKNCNSDTNLLNDLHGLANKYCSYANSKDNDTINFDKSKKRKTEMEEKIANAKINKILQSNKHFSDIRLSSQQNLQIEPLQYQHNSVTTSVTTENKSDDSFGTSKQTHEDCNMDLYFTNLLNTVSEHIILIIEAYECYHRTAHTKNLIDQYLRVRDHFFNLSYTTVVAILLPQENNHNFVTKFIYDTIKVSGNRYSFAQISDVFMEMLKWTKSKKKVISTLPLQFQAANNPQPHNNSLLKQHLRQPPLRHIPDARTDHNRSSASQNNLPNPDQTSSEACIFSSGPPGRQISINVSPMLLNRQSGAPPTFNTSNPVTTFAQDRSYNVISYHGTNPTQPSEPPPWNSKNDFYHRTQMNAPSILPPQPLTLKRKSNETHYNPQLPVVPNYHAIQQTTPHVHRTAPQPAPVAPPPLLQPPYSTYQMSHNTQIAMSQNNIEKQPALTFQNEASDQKAQVENTRSLSTDSGIMSPLHFNSSDATTNANTIGENSLLITHVTSLNPNAEYIEEGSCTVCTSVTKKKCLGCLKFYYCSFECQRVDWTMHKFVCGPTT